jgi:hypothetical protein
MNTEYNEVRPRSGIGDRIPMSVILRPQDRAEAISDQNYQSNASNSYERPQERNSRMRPMNSGTSSLADETRAQLT